MQKIVVVISKPTIAGVYEIRLRILYYRGGENFDMGKCKMSWEDGISQNSQKY